MNEKVNSNKNKIVIGPLKENTEFRRDFSCPIKSQPLVGTLNFILVAGALVARWYPAFKQDDF